MELMYTLTLNGVTYEVADKKAREKLEALGDLDPETLAGSDGATFTPSVSEDGTLSWTNDKNLPNPEPVNIKGRPGEDGHTPVKGEDYFTPDEIWEIKSDIVTAVVASLPIYDGSVIDV